MFSRLATGGARRLATSTMRVGVATRMASSVAPKHCKRTIAIVSGLSLAAAAFALTSDSEAHCAASKVPFTGAPGTVKERTFIAIKPDGVQRGLISTVIERFEKKGYKLVAMKMLWATKDKAESHYADLSKKPFFPGLVKYFTSGPIVAMVWEGTDVIKTGRKILGATNPNAADPGTLRGEFCISVGRNLVHGSDGPDSAQAEIANWFTAAEVSDWPRTTDTWIVENN